jgi:hypothetical protein
MIRPAQIKDKARVIELLRHSSIAAGFHRTENVFHFPLEAAYGERLFLAHMLPHRLCLVLEVCNRAQGVLMATAAEHPFGPVMVARETAWWIEPEHRGLAAIKMLDIFERWARAEGCLFAGMGGLGEAPDVASIYTRRGYRAAETHFLKAL